MAAQKFIKDDRLALDYIKKLGLNPEHGNTEKPRDDAGMFIVRYNPQDSLAGTKPSCDYNVGVNERDNIASALRKNAKDIQSTLDDWFGVDESDKSQRVFISHQTKIDDTHAYCAVTYAGYESDNDGEVSALVSDQISSVIDKRIRMDWNDTAYPVTDEQITAERAKEANRAETDKSFINNLISTPDTPYAATQNATLNTSLCQEPDKDVSKNNGMEM